MISLFRHKPPNVCPRCGSSWQAPPRYQYFTQYEAKVLNSDVFSSRSYSPARNCEESFSRTRYAKRAGQLIFQCGKCCYPKEY